MSKIESPKPSQIEPIKVRQDRRTLKTYIEAGLIEERKEAKKIKKSLKD